MCAICGAIIPPTSGRGRPRKYCRMCIPVYKREPVPARDVSCSRCGARFKARRSNSHFCEACKPIRRSKLLSARVCAECQVSFLSPQPHQRFCSRSCSERHHNRKDWEKRKRHGTKEATCLRCGRIFSAWAKNEPRFCSLLCSANRNTPDSVPIPWATCRCGQAYVKRGRAHCPRPIVIPAPRAVIECPECGDEFLQKVGHQQFCGSDCSSRNRKRRDKARRRALMRDAFVEDVEDRFVFERDGWICQLCFQSVPDRVPVNDPWEATIDHIIPIGRGGTHEYANVQLAHRECNSRKSDGRSWTESQARKAA